MRYLYCQQQPRLPLMDLRDTVPCPFRRKRPLPMDLPHKADIVGLPQTGTKELVLAKLKERLKPGLLLGNQGRPSHRWIDPWIRTVSCDMRY
jgi:hypothetical protein